MQTLSEFDISLGYQMSGTNCTSTDRDTLLTAWTNSSNFNVCLTQFRSTVYGTRFTEGSLQLARNNVGQIWSTWLQGKQIDSTFINTPMGRSMYQLCESIPGLCNNVVPPMCSGYSRDQISRDADLIRWCGCYVTPESSNVAPECDPLCVLQGTIAKSYLSSSGARQECEHDVCVINNVNINAVESTLGAINFSTLCSQCTRDNCTCIVNDVAIKSLESSIPLTVFESRCTGEGSVCQTVVNGVLSDIPCSQLYSGVNKTQINPMPQWVWFVIGILVVLVVMSIVIFSIV